MKHFLVLESEMPHSSTSSILLFKIVIDSAFLPAIPSVLIFVIVLFSIVAVDWFITTMPGNEVWSIKLSKSSTSENSMKAPFPPVSLTLFDLIVPLASESIEIAELPTCDIVLFSMVKWGELNIQIPSFCEF